MDLQKSSYNFHREIEPPSAFLRREWKAIALFGAAFCLAMIAVILVIDPAYFYPRLQTDPLNYYLKGKALADSGSTAAARWAVNMKPFAYVAMPGVLRVPMIMLFADFDQQLKAIQIFNVPIVAAVALISAYILSWTQPVGRHWMAIAFAFGFTLLSPVWIANVFLPLADAPYALFTLATMLVAVELICSDKRMLHRPLLLAFGAVLFVIAFTLRFTAPVLLALVWVLIRGRAASRGGSGKQHTAAVVVTLLCVLALVALNAQAIFGRYLREPFVFFYLGDKVGMLINLFGAAIPSQVIPSFQLGFLHPPIINAFHTSFGTTIQDSAWAGVGVLISCVVVVGAWRSRGKFLPEIAYLLAPLLVLTLMLPSTTRYLMSYQPFFWIFFYSGVAFLASRSRLLTQALHSRRTVLAVVMGGAALAFGLRAWKVAGSASERYFAVTVTRAPTYVKDVATTFRALRTYLESLPAENTLLIGQRGTYGRWKIIANRDYYLPDSTLMQTVKSRDVYMLVECGTLEECQAWDYWKDRLEKYVRHFGDVEFRSVFAAQAGRSRAEVFRLESTE